MSLDSEDEVKKALGIESWRNLSKDRIVKFAAMMPDMGREVTMKIDAFRYTPLPHTPMTNDHIRAGGLVPSDEEWPFLDFCFRSRNFSGLADETHEAAWESLLAIQDDRHGLVSMGADRVPRSQYDRVDSQLPTAHKAGA